MKIESIKIENCPPIENIEMKNLGQLAIIAGPNGVGKTVLIENLFELITQQDRQLAANIKLIMRTTVENEINRFNGKTFTLDAEPNSDFHAFMNETVNIYNFEEGISGAIIRYNSDRIQRKIDENLGAIQAGQHFSRLHLAREFNIQKWQEMCSLLFMKITKNKENVEAASYASYQQQNEIMLKNKKSVKDFEEIIEKNSHPSNKFKEIFEGLFPNKEFILPDIDNPYFFYLEKSQYTNKISNNRDPLPISSLSSGEQELVIMCFELQFYDIHDSVIIIDEPELHLHPSSLLRLVDVLKNIGDGTNQYILFTHSTDLIRKYLLEGCVYFIKPPNDNENQVLHLASNEAEKNSTALQMVMNSLGSFLPGNKFIFIEGFADSIDKYVCQRIIDKKRFNITLVPTGSYSNVEKTVKDIVEEFNSISKNFSEMEVVAYGIRDRDKQSNEEIKENELAGVHTTKEREIEGYFFDETILVHIFKMYNKDATEPKVNNFRNSIKSIRTDSNLSNKKKFVKIRETLQVSEMDLRHHYVEICLSKNSVFQDIIDFLEFVHKS